MVSFGETSETLKQKRKTLLFESHHKNLAKSRITQKLEYDTSASHTHDFLSQFWESGGSGKALGEVLGALEAPGSRGCWDGLFSDICTTPERNAQVKFK